MAGAGLAKGVGVAATSGGGTESWRRSGAAASAIFAGADACGDAAGPFAAVGPAAGAAPVGALVAPACGDIAGVRALALAESAADAGRRGSLLRPVSESAGARVPGGIGESAPE